MITNSRVAFNPRDKLNNMTGWLIQGKSDNLNQPNPDPEAVATDDNVGNQPQERSGIGLDTADPVQKAKEEVIKDDVKDEEQSRQKLGALTATNLVLMKLSNIFPFDLFPDDVIIDTHKVSIVYREFFLSETIHSIIIRDITDVLVETSPFFARLKIVDEGYKENFIVVDFLWKKEALQARRLIQGLVIAHKQGVDLTKLDPEKLKQTIEELGAARREPT